MTTMTTDYRLQSLHITVFYYTVIIYMYMYISHTANSKAKKLCDCTLCNTETRACHLECLHLSS